MRLEAGMRSVLLGLGVVHLGVVLVPVLMLMLVVLLLRSAPRLSMIVFHGGLLGVPLALKCSQILCACLYLPFLGRTHSSMGRSGAPEGCGLASRPGVSALLVGIRIFSVVLLAGAYLGWSLWEHVLFILLIAAAITDESIHFGCY